jgi:Tol biopolymer transport system component
MVSSVFDDSGPFWTVSLKNLRTQRLAGLNGFDGAWNPDGSKLVLSQDHQLLILEIATGQRRSIAINEDGFVWWPRWSPDGERLRYTVTNAHTQGTSIWEVSLSSGSQPKLVLGAPGSHNQENPCCGSWVTGTEFFVFQELYAGVPNIAVAVDGPRAPVPMPLTRGPLSYRGPTPSRYGQYIYARGQLLGGKLVRVNRTTGNAETLLPEASIESAAFSNDGKKLAYTTLPQDTLMFANADGGGSRRAIQVNRRAARPQWSPDGMSVAVMLKSNEQSWRIATVSASDGRMEDVLPEAINQADPTWSPDGNRLAFGRIPALEPNTVQVEILDLRSREVLPVPGSQHIFSPMWSPKGRFLAAIHADSFRLMLFDFQTQIWSEITSQRAGFPFWSRDEKLIYFLDPDAPWIRLLRFDMRTRRIETELQAPGIRQPATPFGRWLGWHPDGNYLAVRDASTQEIFAIGWNIRSQPVP